MRTQSSVPTQLCSSQFTRQTTKCVRTCREWRGETEKQREIVKRPLCFLNLCLHTSHTCTCTCVSSQWPCNEVISSHMTLGEHCVLHSKSDFCMNNVSFTAEILSLWLHGHVPLLSHSSQRTNHLQCCWLEHAPPFCSDRSGAI